MDSNGADMRIGNTRALGGTASPFSEKAQDKLTSLRNLLSTLAISLCAFAHPAQATVTAFLSAGADCLGSNSATFSPGGPIVQVSMCVSTTSERLCGTSYRFVSANADENGRFQIASRTMAPAYNFSNAMPISFPWAINSTATSDLGAGTDDNRPVAAAIHQLIANYDFAPQIRATNSSYRISLDTRFSNAAIDGGDDLCGGNLPLTAAPLAASFEFVQSSPGIASPAFTSANTATFMVGTEGTFLVAASGSPPPTLSLVGGLLPTGVTFNPATGLISGTPAVAGVYPLDFLATNGNRMGQSFMLVVVRPTSTSVPPAIISATSTTFTAGSAGSFGITATGSPAPALSLTGTLPAGVTFNPATGMLSGIPTVPGTFPLVITASSGASVTQAFTLVVAPPRPYFTSANTTNFTVGTAGSFTVSATGSPAPTLSLIGTLPAGLTFEPVTGILSGTPAMPGIYDLTFSAFNGSYATQFFVLRVLGSPGTLAITSSSSAYFLLGTASMFAITATGIPPPTLSVQGVLPAGISFNPATGLLSGTPFASGMFPLSIVASNGASVMQAFTLLVPSASGAPLAFPSSPSPFSPVSQSISFAGPGPQILESAPLVLAAASTFGLPVAFTSSTPSVCTVSGNTVTMLTVGTCTITANQSGGGNISSAPAVTRSFGILPSLVSDTAALTAAVSPLPPAVAGRDLTLSVLVRMRSPAGTITFSENGNAVAGCAQRPLAMLADAVDAAIVTCTLVAPPAPLTGTARRYEASLAYPANHVSGRTSEQLNIDVPFVAMAPAALPALTDYSDIWWAGPAENGWGLSITQHGLVQFNVIFAYDNAGQPLWYVMPGGTWNADHTAYSGALFRPMSSPFNVYSRAQFAPGAPVGHATITFLDRDTATLSHTINGVSGAKSIQRQVFAADSGKPRMVVNDLWWAGAQEDGWGLNIAQQDRMLFPVWYTYDAAGRSTFFTVPGGTWRGTAFTGDLYATTSSSWLGFAYNLAQFATTRVGTMTLDFTDQNNATMTYTVNGIVQTKNIVRQPF